MFLLFDLADMPGMPVAVVPLGDGADGVAVAAALSRRALAEEHPPDGRPAK